MLVGVQPLFWLGGMMLVGAGFLGLALLDRRNEGIWVSTSTTSNQPIDQLRQKAE
jgi:hypothetical protein